MIAIAIIFLKQCIQTKLHDVVWIITQYFSNFFNARQLKPKNIDRNPPRDSDQQKLANS